MALYGRSASAVRTMWPNLELICPPSYGRLSELVTVTSPQSLGGFLPAAAPHAANLRRFPKQQGAAGHPIAHYECSETQSPNRTRPNCARHIEEPSPVVSIAPRWALSWEFFFGTFGSKERAYHLHASQLALGGSSRKPANRVPSALLVANHPNLNGVVADKLTVSSSLLVTGDRVNAHQRTLMAV